jgi:hypothetical protein
VKRCDGLAPHETLWAQDVTTSRELVAATDEVHEVRRQPRPESRATKYCEVRWENPICAGLTRFGSGATALEEKSAFGKHVGVGVGVTIRMICRIPVLGWHGIEHKLRVGGLRWKGSCRRRQRDSVSKRK